MTELTDQELNEQVARKLGWVINKTLDYKPWYGRPGVSETSMKCDHCGKDVCAVFAEYDEAGKFIVICWDCHELDKTKSKG